MKKIKYIFFVFFYLFAIRYFAQTNLVPNPSFENTSDCPNKIKGIKSADFWINPTSSSPDYFNSCSSWFNETVPKNEPGYQIPHSGNAYAGFSPFYINPLVGTISFREYIQTKLDSSLISGEVYCVTYYVSLADSISEYAVNNIGAYFSPNAVSSGNKDPLPYLPQVINPSTNPLTDTSAWTRIAGQFIASGGERYVTIGNFNDNPTSDTVFIQPRNPSYKLSYYYIDDVSVIHLDAGAGKNKGVCNGVGVVLGRPTQPGITYSWQPSEGLSDATIAQPIATPTVTTTYYLTATLTNSGCSKTDSVTVFVSNPVATINTSNSILCPGETGTATVTVSNAPDPYNYSWSTGGTSSQISGLTSQIYSVTVTDANTCTATTAISFTAISAPTATISTTQTTITEGEQITLNGNGGVNYTWSPAATLSCSTCQNPNAFPLTTTTYTLTVTSGYGCTDTATATIHVNPLCTGEKNVFIPNVFSPNNDGKNDVLTIEGNGLTNIYWAIYDRWGNLVFETYNQNQPWDGTKRGSAVEEGVYVYYLKGICSKTNATVSLKGNVSIVK